ncbi:adenylyl-sulfate kinase [Microbacterium sp. RU33B]|uniref:adenylyl-sulfate kinase n=1 Tax=Microbacterium sp. RU33B TaxID=1907390 RepID=UPI00096807DF|nr:adenylyl-sulfate kinase [Microbacterium sp. RU33B]SIT84300.1 sulfate adenylyltransferase [Microbacterium sp. RU33B]
MTVNVPQAVLEGERLETLEFLLLGIAGADRSYKLPAADREGLTASLRVEAAVAETAFSAGRLRIADPDNTPLAELVVEGHKADSAGVWLAGPVVGLRTPEHGPARGHRLGGLDALSGREVVLFGGRLRPADVVALVAHSEPLAFVVEESSDRRSSLEILRQLSECATLMSDARIAFLPESDLGSGSRDRSMAILSAAGASSIVDRRLAPIETSQRGAVIVFTGLSGAGKSTVARALADDLRAAGGQGVVLLDGDHVRAELASELGFGRQDRERNLKRQAWVAARVAEGGGLAICAPIAPFTESRLQMRAKVEPQYPFILVHVSTSLEVSEARDRKGLYAKARAGLIPDFTGIDSPYEVPSDADLQIDTSNTEVAACVVKIRELLEARGIVRAV